MWRSGILTTGLFGLALFASNTFGSVSPVEKQAVAPRYLRVSTAHWNISAEHYRAWMRSVGIMDRITLETHAGDIVAGS